MAQLSRAWATRTRKHTKPCSFCYRRTTDLLPGSPAWLTIAYNPPHTHPRDSPRFPPLPLNCPFGTSIRTVLTQPEWVDAMDLGPGKQTQLRNGAIDCVLYTVDIKEQG